MKIITKSGEKPTVVFTETEITKMEDDDFIAERILICLQEKRFFTYEESKRFLRILEVNHKSKEEYQNWWKDSGFQKLLPENPEEYYSTNS
jgi:hypothetical protein